MGNGLCVLWKSRCLEIKLSREICVLDGHAGKGGKCRSGQGGGECEVEIASREGEKVVENHVPAREEYAEKLREEPLAIGE